MVPTVIGILSHFSPNLFKGTCICMGFIQKLSKPIVTTFEFTRNMCWDFYTVFNVEIFDIMHVVDVHDEPAHFFLGLRTQPHAYNELHHVQLYVYL